jgi:cephalosporin hydroxylase
MGRPIIQLPHDILAMQEIIWEVKPDLIIETGIAHGGSLIMYASFLEMMGINNGAVLGIDIDIREYNRNEIENHRLFKRITLFEGSSISEEIVSKVNSFAKSFSKVLVILDSNHTHEHVKCELELYSPLVSKDSYCIVFDTFIDDLSNELFSDRPWSKGNSPKTAVKEFLKKNQQFKIDQKIQDKLVITAAPDGFLKRVN